MVYLNSVFFSFFFLKQFYRALKMQVHRYENMQAAYDFIKS